MESIIIKYITNTINEKELQLLYDWLQNEKNQEIFKSYIKANQQIDLLLNEINPKEEFNKIEKQLHPTRKEIKLRPSRMKWSYLVAASLLVLVGSTLYFSMFIGQNTRHIKTLKSQPITIKMDNGDKIYLTDQDSAIHVAPNTIANQNSLAHNLNYYDPNKKDEASALVYNTINIPYGKKYKLILSDSTIVHLNAGSFLKYPVAFSTSGPRKVSIGGEAFFEVKKDKNRPFIVKTNRVAVEVLGTKFNVSDFGDKDNSEVVLVEGAVKMREPNNNISQVLQPGEMGSYHQNANALFKEKVETALYTSWLHGKLTFRNKSFNTIVKALERNFNVEIINKNKELAGEKFNASFNKNVGLEKILSYFKEAYGIKYSLENDKITIK